MSPCQKCKKSSGQLREALNAKAQQSNIAQLNPANPENKETPVIGNKSPKISIKIPDAIKKTIESLNFNKP